MKKRLLRYLSALTVSIICTYSGLQRVAFADTAQVPACGMNDVFAWQDRLENPTEEATPAYVQRVSEAFITDCPNRPEVAEAHRIAALAAGWGNDAEASAVHFEQAGYVTDVESLFMNAAVLLATGENERAWRMRDQAIEFWLARMTRRGIADVEVDELKGGDLISLRFRETDADLRQSRLWIVKPDGAGWPAALSISSDRQLNAFHKMRAGQDASDLQLIRLYRCTSRKLLGRGSKPVSDEEISATATAALQAYLFAPDIPKSGEFETCLFAQRMLPDMTSGNAIAIQ
ncbi:hypothetical protein WNY37_00785 [Henriciella sp. AS95]|uniref:hypothetical protein n=1 Tax=Henriciella sp. AS95 TaxID=3135782 RepID=UPI00316FE18E